MDNRKFIGMDVHQASISIAVSDAAGKGADGMHPRNESSHGAGVHPGTAWQLVGNLRGRDQCTACSSRSSPT